MKKYIYHIVTVGFVGMFLLPSTLSAAGDTWAIKASLPRALSGPGSATINNIVYSVGGFEAGNSVASVFAYDPVTNLWTTKASLPIPVGRPAVTAYNGKIYALGGERSGYIHFTVMDMNIYNPVTNSWSVGASYPDYYRDQPAVAAFNNAIWVMGGDGCIQACNTSRKDTYAYFPDSNTWVAEPSIPMAISAGMAASANGKLYVFGGQFQPGTNIDPTSTYNETMIFNPATNSWSYGPSMPVGVSRAAVTTGPNGKIYLFGGYYMNVAHIGYMCDNWDWSDGFGAICTLSHVASGSEVPDFYVDTTVYTSVANTQEFDPTTNTWTSRAPIRFARADSTATVANGKIYVFGGGMDHGGTFMSNAPVYSTDPELGENNEYTPPVDATVNIYFSDHSSSR